MDTSKVKLQDIPYNDNGSYFGSGSHTWTYKAVEGDSKSVVFDSRKREKADKAPQSESICEETTEHVKQPLTCGRLFRIWRMQMETS